MIILLSQSILKTTKQSKDYQTNKAEFNKLVRKVLAKNMKHNSNEEEAHHVINTFIENIILALKDNDEVALVGFGKFYKTKVETRKERNPKTSEMMTIPAYVQPRFTAGKNLKGSCNNIT